MRHILEDQALRIDVVGYVDIEKADRLMKLGKLFVKQYVNGFKIGGYKTFLDGSPQGKTAWLTEPYLSAEAGYCGYPIYKREQVEA